MQPNNPDFTADTEEYVRNADDVMLDLRSALVHAALTDETGEAPKDFADAMRLETREEILQLGIEGAFRNEPALAFRHVRLPEMDPVMEREVAHNVAKEAAKKLVLRVPGPRTFRQGMVYGMVTDALRNILLERPRSTEQ